MCKPESNMTFFKVTGNSERIAGVEPDSLNLDAHTLTRWPRQSSNQSEQVRSNASKMEGACTFASLRFYSIAVPVDGVPAGTRVNHCLFR